MRSLAMTSRVLKLSGFLPAATALVAFVILISLTAGAQRITGTLRGEVSDQNGAAVTSAKLTATNQQTGVEVHTISTGTGGYEFPTLLPGPYTVKVESEGFRQSVTTDVIVSANNVTDRNVTLSIGAQNESVEVNAGVTEVQTTTSTITNEYSTTEILNLPTGSGSPLQLSIFAPNTTAQQGGIGGVGGAVGGQRPDLNSFTVDGVDDNNIGVTGNNSNVIQDAVSGFNLVTNQFSAEYANAASGQFNIVTKSGTNSWHGSVEDYVQNRNLNALDNLTKQALADGSLDHIPRLDQTRLGGTVGGPLKKNRWFIFGAYEFTNFRQDGNNATVTVPTSAGLQSLLSMAVDQEAQTLLSVLPTASNATGSITVNGTSIPTGQTVLFSPFFIKEHDAQVNTDYKLASHQISARFLFSNQSTIYPVTTPQPQFNQPGINNNRKIALTDSWIISPRFVNDLRLSYSRFLQQIATPSKYDSYNTYHLDDLNNLTIGPNDTQRSLENEYQIIDNQTFQVDRHTLKWGAEYRHYIAPTFFLSRSHGEYDYPLTQDLVNDLVPGNAGNTLRGAGSPLFSQNQNSFYWFFQDDFKVTPRLTLNLGLRYEFNSNFASSKTQALNAISNVPGVIEFHDPTTQKNNYAPRLGFAWDPTGSAKWAVRGGFGIAYGRTFGNLPQLALPPQYQTEENELLVCAAFNPAPSWCTTGTAFLANGGLPATYTLVNDPSITRALTQGRIPDQKAPKTLNWTLSVQRELFRGGVLEARYLGTRGLFLPVQVRLNSEGAFSAGLAPLPTYSDPSQVPATVTSPASTLATFDNYNPQPLSQYGFFGNVTEHQSIGSSTYHGGALSFSQSLRHGLTFRANYTYSHTIDDSTAELFSTFLNPRRPEDAVNLRADRGNSALDVRHKLAFAWTYALPQAHSASGFLKVLLNGYELNGSYIAQTGQPISILSPYDANDNFDVAGDRAIFNPHGLGNTATDVNAVCNAAPGGAVSIVAPDSNGAWSGCGTGNDANVVGYLAMDPNARYISAQLGAKSTVGRNSFFTPGFGIWNISVFKNTHFTENAYLQLRVEMFNALNHPNYTVAGNLSVFSTLTGTNALADPAYNLATNGNPDFLNPKVFSGGSRNLQLVAKIVF
ncbi:MAG TPA: TonB-dependent receptor [Terriglobales bacterium]|nr:TonB-dependent receptor [Terriglobales bacterium]